MLVSPWAVCFLACFFLRLSALLRLMYDMLTPVSEHAALRTALVHKRCGGSTAALPLVAELFDALYCIAVRLSA
jgi:hypothetical protein